MIKARKINHWSSSGDLVIEQKTLFRQVGWLQSDLFYSMNELPDNRKAPYSPVYIQIATWVEDEGWND